MSECNRPTLTFPEGLYNATQVRLYGVKPPSRVFSTDSAAKTPHKSSSFSSHVKTTGKDAQFNASVDSDIAKMRKARIDEDEIYRELRAKYPIDKSLFGKITWLDIDTKQLGEVYITTLEHNTIISCGIIVGYSYEGHCYDLPKPKIMLLNVEPEKIPDDDCGYSNKPNYLLWIVDKLSQCVELEVNQGFVEQVVLEANLPGKRAPTMFAGKMMMGHRSGRLSE